MRIEKYVGKNQNLLKWLFGIVLPKLPFFLSALPFVFLMRILRPFIWIRLCPIWERIGHATGNIDVYLLEHKHGKRQDIRAINLYYPNTPEKCNQQLVKMWARVIPVSRFWRRVSWANQEIPGWEPFFFDGERQDRDIYGLTNDAPPPVSFTLEEEAHGQKILRAMGIPKDKPFICLHARDSAFLDKLLPTVNWTYHNYRDVNIANYVSAAQQLVARGYYVIRMGAVVKEKFPFSSSGIIDYANMSWRDDFMDIYLSSKCHFFIGSGSGLDCVASLFRKQLLYVNFIPMGLVPAWSFKVLIIFKKIWIKEEKRFMKFREMLELGKARAPDTRFYEDRGLEVVENTPEEIRDAVIEKEERIKGCWQARDEDERLQSRFWALYEPNEFNQVFNARIGSGFLRQYRDLLD